MQNCHWTVDRITDDPYVDFFEIIILQILISLINVKFDISLPQNDIKKMDVETSHMQSSANLKYD